ncbi:MAG: ferrous iron transport protein A [Chromatiaceae bacterium]|nr:ferrous iron transport protein A [Chromatiaceae bacterium]
MLQHTTSCPSLIKLSELPHETPARLVEIRGGRNLTRRLLALGLRQGSVLNVVQRRGQGLVLAAGDGRIAMGFGVAEKLWVCPEPLASGGCAEEANPEPGAAQPERRGEPA